ncbi:hypothetical protein ABZ234_03705 [Nocardiopsis sp. NPDC006198]|uniref:hypothetical protein n=1 Tax=Nocardiopsis sp. NPDC006198 TaxID=3154472 RepID=UPI0033B96895
MVPLPDRNIPWPPKETQRPRELYDEWGAWYGGDPTELARVYGGSTGGVDLKTHPWQYSGGVRGTVGRLFWGAPPTDGQQPTRLHVPLASDIASVNADLLYAEPPSLTVAEEHQPTQERLDVLLTTMHSALIEGAEICSPYGGVFQRASWNTAVADHIIVEPIIPDCAAPEWSGQYLTAVTFWRVLSDEDGSVWRHLERHEPGRVYHGLYRGTEDRLGRVAALQDHPGAEGLAPLVDSNGGISTGARGLAVEYFPNMRPNRLIRGSALGRSDYQGVEQLFDSLDETWSALVREIRLAKARLVVPDSFLDNLGRGQGQRFDVDREIYKGVNGMLQQQGQGLGDLLQLIQPAIRIDEHLAGAQALAEQIVRGAGFSAQTFGEGPSDVNVTATEVQHRERRTFSNRARKLGYQTGPLKRFSRTVLEMDAHVFPEHRIRPQPVMVQWPDGVQDAPEATARTVQLWEAAGAASTEIRVRAIHPDWHDEQVVEEVTRIQEENPVINPFVAAGIIPRQSEGADEEPPAPAG